eukprot:3580801-Prymnesium_polylepis.1
MEVGVWESVYCSLTFCGRAKHATPVFEFTYEFCISHWKAKNAASSELGRPWHMGRRYGTLLPHGGSGTATT